MSEGLIVGDDMVSRGARVLAGHVPVGTEEQFVRHVLGAVFSGVPLCNYGVGLALAADNVDAVVLVAHKGGSPAAIICANGDGEGFDTLTHNLRANYGPKGLRSLTLSKIGE